MMAGARSGREPEGRAESGNAVVELALVLPLFLLIVAGIIDLGTLYWENRF
ncbi:MAG TPA: TadE/TadG family type IV pilus assembly protein [Desulfobaccales bacterium]